MDSSIALTTVKISQGIVEDLGDPYLARPGLGGMAAYPPKAMAVVLHSHGSRGAHLPKDGGPPQDEPGPRHEDRAAQDTLKEHHMARLRHDPRAIPA